VRRVAIFLAAMAASLAPTRLWPRLPPSFSMTSAAFASGLVTLFAGAGIGIRGFLAHAAQGSSLGTGAVLDVSARGHEVGLSPGFNALAIFTFLLLTPAGWLTLYLIGGGGLRLAAAWFDDPFGDPILTGIDAIAWRLRARSAARATAAAREAREGPEVADRLVSAGAAGIAGCDFVIVSSRRKPGWARGAAVFTGDGCYRIGEPVEQTIAGRLRTLYPLTAHDDLEVIRRAVRYELPEGQWPTTIQRDPARPD
jgi:hypothetical protein